MINKTKINDCNYDNSKLKSKFKVLKRILVWPMKIYLINKKKYKYLEK